MAQGRKESTRARKRTVTHAPLRKSTKRRRLGRK